MARRKIRRGWERLFMWAAALAVVPVALFTLISAGLHGPFGLAGWIAGLAQGALLIPISFMIRARVDRRIEQAAKAAAARRRAASRSARQTAGKG